MINTGYLKALTFSVLFWTAPLAAQEATGQQVAGQREYMAACVSCHGVSGRGDGPLADLLTVKVSDLTKLSVDNGGTFPQLDVMMFIDGRSRIRAHGGDMPVWGQQFAADAEAIVGQVQAENVAKRRALSLALYIQTLQQ